MGILSLSKQPRTFHMNISPRECNYSSKLTIVVYNANGEYFQLLTRHLFKPPGRFPELSRIGKQHDPTRDRLTTILRKALVRHLPLYIPSFSFFRLERSWKNLTKPHCLCT